MESTLFGQEDRGSNPPDRVRDRAELRLFDAFFRAGKPILGICRGMQVINVALGGDIIQDLPPEVRPFHVPRGKEDQVHPIRAAEDSVLASLYGPVFPVNSCHLPRPNCRGGARRGRPLPLAVPAGSGSEL